MISAGEIRKRVFGIFPGARTQRAAQLIPGAPGRPDPSIHQRGHGPIQENLPGPGKARLHKGGHIPEMSACWRQAQRSRKRGTHCAPPHLFSKCSGNFSFGDYFKEDAIRLAWNFVTVELGLDKEKLFVSIFRDDDEAGELWRKVAGVPAERIFRLGERGQFSGPWATPAPAARVPKSMWTRARTWPAARTAASASADCDRYLEIWNLVFMQFNRSEDGTLTPLPKPSIDTGMGLERVTAVLSGQALQLRYRSFPGPHPDHGPKRQA